jgi:hypothetical protein
VLCFSQRNPPHTHDNNDYDAYQSQQPSGLTAEKVVCGYTMMICSPAKNVVVSKAPKNEV